MEPEGSLQHSQMIATCPYPDPPRTSPHPHILLPDMILHLRLSLPSGPFPSGFASKTVNTSLQTSIRATCPAHLILLHFITRTILGEQYRSLSSSLCNFLHFPVNPELLEPNSLLNTLFSNTISLRSSRNVSDQVSQPYKTTDKIIVIYLDL